MLLSMASSAFVFDIAADVFEQSLEENRSELQHDRDHDFSESFGTKSFNINVDDRQECMEAIFNNKDFDITNCGESVRNLYGRYTDIVDVFPADITDDMLPAFL